MMRSFASVQEAAESALVATRAGKNANPKRINQMKQIDDIYLPDADTHFEALCHRKGVLVSEYQNDRIKFAISQCQTREVAIEIGSHCGIHSRLLAAAFDEVYAFEAHPDTFNCLKRNIEPFDNVKAFNFAIGRRTEGSCFVDDYVDGNTGNVQIDANEGQEVPNRSIDSLNMPAPDFMKLDIQGAELNALRGARLSIIAGSPLIQFEDEPESKLRRKLARSGAAREFLKDLSGEQCHRIGSDYFYHFPNGAWRYTKYRNMGAYHWEKYKSGKFRAIIDATAEYITGQNHASIIDVGCGDGVWSGIINRLSQERWKIEPAYGVERDSIAVNLALEKGVPCAIGHAHRLRGFEFEAAFFSDILEHIPHPEHVAAEMARRECRDVYVVNPTPNQSNWHISEMEHDEMAAMFKAVGYYVVYREGHRITSRNFKTFFHFRLKEPGS